MKTAKEEIIKNLWNVGFKQHKTFVSEKQRLEYIMSLAIEETAIAIFAELENSHAVCVNDECATVEIKNCKSIKKLKEKYGVE